MGIERRGNCPRRPAFDKFAKNPPHDLGLAFVDGDAQEIEPFVRSVIVGLVAKQAVETFGDNDVEQARLCRSDQGEKAETIDDRRARDLAILECHRDRHPFTRTDFGKKDKADVDLTPGPPISVRPALSNLI